MGFKIGGQVISANGQRIHSVKPEWIQSGKKYEKSCVAGDQTFTVRSADTIRGIPVIELNDKTGNFYPADYFKPA